MTIRSNRRWSSDALEFMCWKGDIVRIAFALDYHDRKVIGWTATTAGISGEMIRDMMVHGVEKRFGTSPAPAGFNGSPIFDRGDAGFQMAVVKAVKRDYIRVNWITGAASAIAQIETWMKDNNNMHPLAAGLSFTTGIYQCPISTRRASGLTGSTPLKCSENMRPESDNHWK
jgi:putative transposase